MADLEGFFGPESSGQVDSASFEKFKERIKDARSQIKALKIGEKKQRAKEEKLIKILLSFVKNNKKKDLMILITRLLEQNIPAAFILSIVVLGNEEVKKNIEKENLLNEGVSEESKGNAELEERGGFALALFGEDKTLPIKLKAEIDDWLKKILNQALEYPYRVIKNAVDEEGSVKLPVTRLFGFVLRDFLKENGQDVIYEKVKEFSAFFMRGVMEKVRQKIESQKEIEEKK
jgi:hypothetical protein